MIPAEDFEPIIKELKRRPLEFNAYRDIAGEGLTQAFGLVNRRCLPPDYSRQNWKRAYLYHLLLEFGKKHVDISYNAITVNQNYRANKHYDKNNLGESYLVAFGSYTGGDLLIHEGDLSGNHDIYCKPLVTDFSKVLHSVSSFVGDRFSLVYYWLDIGVPDSIHIGVPAGSVRFEDGKYWFYRGEEKITTGLPHPLKGRTRKEILETALKKKQNK